MKSVFFNSRLWMRAAALTAMLAFVVFASPRLGQEDIPELPAPDGSGEVPEMILSMITNPAVGPGQPSKLKLSSLRGKVVMLDMFWSQCSHCRDHAPHMVELYNQYKMRGLNVLGLATDRNDTTGVNNVRAFLRDTKINYPTAFLTTEIRAYYADPRNGSVPQMVLFGPDGKMVKRWIGWTEQVSKEVKAAIESQLGKAPVVKPGSKATSRDTARRVNRA
jgi:thiol-disulfide isomerase/thioredoxin